MVDTANDPYASEEFDKAYEGGGGQSLPPGGVFDCEMVLMKNQASAKHRGTTNFIVELVVEKSSLATVAAGAKVAYICSSRFPSFFSNVRRGIAQISGGKFEKIDRKAVANATCPANPFGGAKVRVTTIAKPTSKQGTYTAHEFELLTVGPTMKKLMDAAAAAQAQG